MDRTANGEMESRMGKASFTTKTAATTQVTSPKGSQTGKEDSLVRKAGFTKEK